MNNPFEEIEQTIMADQALRLFKQLVMSQPESKACYEVIRKYTDTDNAAMMLYMELGEIGNQQNTK